MGCAGKKSISRHRCHIFGAIFRRYFQLFFKNLFFSMFSTWRSDMMSRKQVWECFLWCSKIYSCSVLIQSYYNSNILIILQWQRELEAVVSNTAKRKVQDDNRRAALAMCALERKKKLGYVVDWCVLPPMLADRIVDFILTYYSIHYILQFIGTEWGCCKCCKYSRSSHWMERRNRKVHLLLIVA